MTRKAWTAIIVILIILVAVVLIVVLQPSASSSDSKDIVIGWIGPLSGEYASYGQMVKNGTEIAVDEINAGGGIDGKTLVVKYEDDQLKPAAGVAAFRKLVSIDKVPVVIQAAGSNVMLAEAPIAQEEGIVLISPTCTNPAISDAGDFVFRIAPSDLYQGRVIAEICYEQLDARTAAVLYINNDYGAGLARVFERQYAELGGEIVLKDGSDPETRDFRTALGKTAASDPDVVFLASLYQDAALIVKQARELALDFQFIGGDGCFAPELLERAGDAAEGMLVVNMHWAPESDDPLVANFIRQFRARHNTNPEVYAALGYDCLRVVAEAMRGNGHDPDGIRQALHTLREYPGLTGPTTFDANGDVQKTYDLFLIHNNAFVRH